MAVGAIAIDSLIGRRALGTHKIIVHMLKVILFGLIGVFALILKSVAHDMQASPRAHLNHGFVEGNASSFLMMAGS